MLLFIFRDKPFGNFWFRTFQLWVVNLQLNGGTYSVTQKTCTCTSYSSFFFLHTYWLLIPELYCSFCYPQVYYIYVFFIEGFSTDETEAKVGHWDYFITWWRRRNEQVKLLININIYNNTYDPFTAWIRNYVTKKHSITVWIKSFNKKCNKLGTLLKKFHVVIPKLILKFFICNYY